MTPGRITGLTVVAVLMATCAVTAHARDISFQKRVEAQEAIERVYHSHRAGTPRPFDEAVPREVLEQHLEDLLDREV